MPPTLAGYVHRVRMPFNANAIGQAAARAALGDRAHVDRSRTENLAGIEQVTSGLRALSMKVTPSVGNFVLAEVADRKDTMELYQALLVRGVVVRPVGIYGLPRHLRITIGTAAQNSRFLDTVKAVLS